MIELDNGRIRIGFDERTRSLRLLCAILALMAGLCHSVSAGGAGHQGSIGHYLLLSDNLSYEGLTIKTGARYTYEPEFQKDVMSNVQRAPDMQLTDGGTRWNDWDSALIFKQEGIQAVIFDLQAPYKIAGARIQSKDLRYPPLGLTVKARAQMTDSWTDLGKTNFTSEWCEFVANRPVAARYVRLEFKVAWSVISEIQIFGSLIEPQELVEKKGAIVYQGKPAAVIAVPADPSFSVVRGARELQRVIAKASGPLLPVCYEREVGDRPAIYVGPTEAAAHAGLTFAQTYPDGEGYRIVYDGKQAYLLGNDARLFSGSEHACYDFLERLTGVRWLYPDAIGEVLEPQSTLLFKPCDVTAHPQVMFREIGMYWDSNGLLVKEWERHNRLNGAPMPNGANIAVGVPVAQFATSHPEYYALVGDKRQPGANPCTSNPDVIRLTADAILAAYSNNSDMVGYGLMQLDGPAFCTCSNCRALDGPTVGSWYGNMGPRLMQFTKSVEALIRLKDPDRSLYTSAYWHSLTAPLAVTSAPGVRAMVVFASCLAHAIDDTNCPTQRAYKPIVEQWERIASPISIRDYAIPANWYQMVRPQLETQLRNMRFYKSVGYGGYYLESWPSFGPFGPIYWAYARSAWEDPDKLEADGLWREWCRQYGPAAEPMQAYFRVLEKAIAGSTAHHPMGSSWNMPSPEAIYTTNVLDEAETHLRAAQKAAGNGTAIQKERVDRDARLWAYTRTVMQFIEANTRACEMPDDAARRDQAIRLLRQAREQSDRLAADHIISGTGAAAFMSLPKLPEDTIVKEPLQYPVLDAQ